MRRLSFIAIFATGALCLAGAVYAVASRSSADGSPFLVFAALAGLLSVGWYLYQSWQGDPGSDTESTYPGRPTGPAPETTPDDQPMSGAYFTQTIQTAIERTESTGDIDEGLAVVRPSLRATLTNVLSEGGYDEDSVRATLSRGDWTDDQVAAAVLDPNVPLPTLTLRERLTMWLFPERFVTAFTRAAVDAIRAAADETLPAIPGESAPRPVPTSQPTIEELTRDVGGDLNMAHDPFESASGGHSDEMTDGRTVHEKLGVLDGGDEE